MTANTKPSDASAWSNLTLLQAMKITAFNEPRTTSAWTVATERDDSNQQQTPQDKRFLAEQAPAGETVITMDDGRFAEHDYAVLVCKRYYY